MYPVCLVGPAVKHQHNPDRTAANPHKVTQYHSTSPTAGKLQMKSTSRPPSFFYDLYGRRTDIDISRRTSGSFVSRIPMPAKSIVLRQTTTSMAEFMAESSKQLTTVLN